MTTLSSLVKAMEEAPCGSRGLDSQIKIALDDPTMMTHPGSIRPATEATYDKASVALADWPWGADAREDEGVALMLAAPNYTTSLDAAMTLVPDGWDFRLDKDGKEFDVEMWDRDPLNPSCQFTGSPYKRSAPLALCIASLKARLALSSGRDDVREKE